MIGYIPFLISEATLMLHSCSASLKAWDDRGLSQIERREKKGRRDGSEESTK